MAGILLASPAALGLAIAALPPPAAAQEPTFVALAPPPTKGDAAHPATVARKPLLAASTPPVETQTVASRDAIGRVRIHCREVPLHGAHGVPRPPVHQP